MITRTLSVLQVSLCPEEDEKYDTQVREFSKEIRELSRGLYQYEVTQQVDLSPDFEADGLLLQQVDIEGPVDERKLDEVWVFGSGKTGTSLFGHDPFYLGLYAPTYPGKSYRRFPIMHISDDPMYAFVRRFEHTMHHVYRDYPTFKNHWEHFIRSENTHPGHASCGSMLYPPNGRMGEYNSKKMVMSDCDDWKRFPELSGRIRWVDSEEWGGTLDGYMRWWLKHIPQGIHKTDGIHQNWWHYVMNPELVK